MPQSSKTLNTSIKTTTLPKSEIKTKNKHLPGYLGLLQNIIFLLFIYHVGGIQNEKLTFCFEHNFQLYLCILWGYIPSFYIMFDTENKVHYASCLFFIAGQFFIMVSVVFIYIMKVNNVLVC